MNTNYSKDEECIYETKTNKIVGYIKENCYYLYVNNDYEPYNPFDKTYLNRSIQMSRGNIRGTFRPTRVSKKCYELYSDYLINNKKQLWSIILRELNNAN